MGTFIEFEWNFRGVSGPGFMIRQEKNTVEPRFFEPHRETEIGSKKSGVRKIEGGMKSRFIYKELVFHNQESKQKYYGTLIQFLNFHLNSHTLGFCSTQKLEPPCTHDNNTSRKARPKK